jgi:hypothetical protein
LSIITSTIGDVVIVDVPALVAEDEEQLRGRILADYQRRGVDEAVLIGPRGKGHQVGGVATEQEPGDWNPQPLGATGEEAVHVGELPWRHPHAVAERRPQEDLNEGIDQVVDVKAPARGAERVQEPRVDRVRVEGRAVPRREGALAARPHIGAEGLAWHRRAGRIVPRHLSLLPVHHDSCRLQPVAPAST